MPRCLDAFGDDPGLPCQVQRRGNAGAADDLACEPGGEIGLARDTDPLRRSPR